MFGQMDQGTPATIAKRVKVFQPATLHLGRTVARIHLLDLSLTGAQAHAPEPPAEGARISVECAGAHVRARVVWRSGQRFGIAFALQLSEQEAQSMAGVPVSAAQVPIAVTGGSRRRV